MIVKILYCILYTVVFGLDYEFLPEFGLLKSYENVTVGLINTEIRKNFIVRYNSPTININNNQIKCAQVSKNFKLLQNFLNEIAYNSLGQFSNFQEKKSKSFKKFEENVENATFVRIRNISVERVINSDIKVKRNLLTNEILKFSDENIFSNLICDSSISRHYIHVQFMKKIRTVFITLKLNLVDKNMIVQKLNVENCVFAESNYFSDELSISYTCKPITNEIVLIFKLPFYVCRKVQIIKIYGLKIEANANTRAKRQALVASLGAGLGIAVTEVFHNFFNSDSIEGTNINILKNNQRLLEQTMEHTESNIEILQRNQNSFSEKFIKDICTINDNYNELKIRFNAYIIFQDFLKKLNSELQLFEKGSVPKFTDLYEHLIDLCIILNYKTRNQMEIENVCKIIIMKLRVSLVSVHLENNNNLSYGVIVKLELKLPRLDVKQSVASQLATVGVPFDRKGNLYKYLKLDVPNFIFKLNDQNVVLDDQCEKEGKIIICYYDYYNIWKMKKACAGNKNDICGGNFVVSEKPMIFKTIKNILLISSANEVFVKIKNEKSEKIEYWNSSEILPKGVNLYDLKDNDKTTIRVNNFEIDFIKKVEEIRLNEILVSNVSINTVEIKNLGEEPVVLKNKVLQFQPYVKKEHGIITIVIVIISVLIGMLLIVRKFILNSVKPNLENSIELNEIPEEN